MTPLALLTRAMDAAADRVQATDRILVEHNRRRWWWVVAFDLTLFVASVAAWTTWTLWRGTWVGLFAGVLVGLQLGRASLVGLRRAAAYRSGWLRGRSAMVHALAEAQQRGIPPQAWLEGELERDWAVLGIDPMSVEDQD